MAVRTTLFLSNRSQAVHLPKAVAFSDAVHEEVIVADGTRRVIVPANAVWDEFFDDPGMDLSDRNQPAIQDRNRS